MLEKIKNVLTSQAGFYTGLFALLAIVGWFINGWFGKHFSIGDLTMIYGWIVGQLSLKHGVDSIFNSPKGEKPND